MLDGLVGPGPGAAVFVARRVDCDFLIEEASPRRELAGSRLRIPARAQDHPEELRLATAEIRLPLDWTLACGGRPDSIAVRPIGQAGYVLIVTGAGEPPAPTELARATGELDAILAGGQVTQRDQAVARHVRDLVDHLPFPVVFIDSHSFNALVNDPARDLLGLAAAEEGSARVHLALRSLVSAAGVDPVTTLATDQSDRLIELVHGERQFEVTIRSIARDRLAGRLWVFRDVTAEREAARFKDELIANVSHELRTPLTSIVGALSLLKRIMAPAADPDVARLLTIADGNAARLGRLVDDLLDMGQLEAGQIEIVPRPVDLGWLIADTVEHSRPYAERLGVSLAFARPRRRRMALVDPDRMAQVLGNVLSNAAKFSPRGGEVQVTLSLSGRQARVRVVDNGRGMTRAFQQRLFTRFVRERDGTSHQPGTGLGLAIARGIIEAMQGTIAIRSAPGRGTIVTLTVPLADQPVEPSVPVQVAADL